MSQTTDDSMSYSPLVTGSTGQSCTVSVRPGRRTPMPTSVRVGPITYRILCSERDTLAMQVVERQSEGLCAQINYQAGAITLDHNLSASQQRASLVHELFHAVQHYVGIKPEGTVANEEVAERMAYAWLDTLQRNLQLVKWLMEGAGE